MKRPRPRAEDFTLGWICALHIELTTATAILDEEYDCNDDTAQYTLGRIGRHNVVVICLPAGCIGISAATAVATEMLAKFPSLRMGLMVGIGGGIPSLEADIRLGDVVISQPQGTYGGVVQYDFGKIVSGGLHTRGGSLNAPPSVLLSAVSKLASNLNAGRSNIPDHLSLVTRLSGFARHDAGSDILFHSSYNHIEGTTCDGCQKDMAVTRTPRKSEEVVVHYGTIASGNQVIKDALERDRLRAELESVLCFEMEAAGLMNILPCLVIRGICDYADSHKNKKWQPFAAAAAAACAKEILSFVPGPNQHTAGNSLEVPEYNRYDNCVHGNVGGAYQPAITVSSNGTTLCARSVVTPDQRQRYLESLKFTEIEVRHATISNAHAKTCRWLLNKSEYQEWLSVSKHHVHHGFLWIKGSPATGKSTIMKFAFANAKKSMPDTVAISFFFNARGGELEKSVLGMYRSLLFQLLEKIPDLQDVFDMIRLAAPNHTEYSRWGVEPVKNLFQHAIEKLGQRSVVCFIDALDECDEDQVREMVAFFKQLGYLAASSQFQFRVCFSSRHYPYITIGEGLELVLEGQEGHCQDIRDYVQSELKAGSGKLAEQIKAEILEKAAGIFLWVVLVIRILNKECDHGRARAFRDRLREIPKGLEELFKGILKRDNHNIKELILCLEWILYAVRPLKREELYFAILAGVEPKALTAWDSEEHTKQDMEKFILSSSKGLAELTRSKNQTVQFIHESVRDFLKGYGLDRLRSDLGGNFRDRSHELLKKCCETYMAIDTSEHLPLRVPLPVASSKDAASLRQLVSEKFPFSNMQCGTCSITLTRQMGMEPRKVSLLKTSLFSSGLSWTISLRNLKYVATSLK
jgi:nucleoside phosphorylase